MEEKFSIKNFIKVFNEIIFEKQNEIDRLKEELKSRDKEMENLKFWNNHYENKYGVNSELENKNTADEVPEDTAEPF